MSYIGNRCILLDTGEHEPYPHVHAKDYITGAEKRFYFTTERGKKSAWTKAQTFCDEESKKHGDYL